MKNKVTSTVSAICSALFIIAIIYLAAGIYIENQKGPEKAQARFDTLMLSTRTAAAKYNIGTPDFSSQFIKAIDDISDFSILRLKINDQLVYNYPPQSFSLPSPEVVKAFSQTQQIPNGSRISLEASIYIMKPATIYNHAKISFLLILTGTLLSLLMIFLTTGKDGESSYMARNAKISDGLYKERASMAPPKAEKNKPTVKAQEEKLAEAKNLAQTEQQKPIPAKADDAPTDYADDKPAEKSALVANIQKQEEPRPVDSETVPDFAETAFEETAGSENAILPTPILETDVTDFTEPVDVVDYSDEIVENDIIDEIPSDFYEKDTIDEAAQEQEEEIVVHPQAQLEQALDAYLAGNENISFAVIKLEALEKDSYDEVLKNIKKEFAEPSEFYEYDTTSIAIIMKNTSLETAMSYSENLLKNMTTSLYDAHKIYIGLSSKNGRQISSHNFIVEAEQAVRHAVEDPDSSIVAFKANPEKYKEHIENRA